MAITLPNGGGYTLTAASNTIWNTSSLTVYTNPTYTTSYPTVVTTFNGNPCEFPFVDKNVEPYEPLHAEDHEYEEGPHMFGGPPCCIQCGPFSPDKYDIAAHRFIIEEELDWAELLAA